MIMYKLLFATVNHKGEQDRLTEVSVQIGQLLPYPKLHTYTGCPIPNDQSLL